MVSFSGSVSYTHLVIVDREEHAGNMLARRVQRHGQIHRSGGDHGSRGRQGQFNRGLGMERAIAGAGRNQADQQQADDGA